jgi:hypothetical protein
VSDAVVIRRLVASDALAYWQTRNQGLKEFPDAFTTSYEEGVATPPKNLPNGLAISTTVMTILS